VFWFFKSEAILFAAAGASAGTDKNFSMIS
jgi:hypothetical protein